MIRRESLQKKLAMAAIAGMLMLLLAASCVAQTPLEVGGPENCTDCSGNASADQTLDGSIAEDEASSSPGFENAVQEMDSSNASISQALGAADLVSPSSILNTGRPTYVWEGVSSSQYYCLEVMDDRNDVVLKQWYDASDYPSDTISVTPLQSLDPGDYTWRILCWNCQNQNEPPSPEMDFTVCTSTSFPGRATLISPKDTIGTRNPTFVWSPVAGCTQYCLKVANANYQNVPILEKCYGAEEVISGQICSITPGLDLDPGNYRWWIQTINCKGEGPWSNYKSFRYQNRSPGRSTPISPRGLTSSTPTFIWTAASAATTYHLELINYRDGIDVLVMEDPSIDANEVTIGSRCSFILGTLPDDDSVYYWRIHASNDAGDGAWSGWRYFETHCALKPGTDKKKARTG